MNDKITIVFGEEDNLEISFKEKQYNIDSEETIRFNVGGVELKLNSQTGVLQLIDNTGKVLSEVDFPTEKIITNAYYDYDNQELVLEYENAQAVRVPIKTDFSNHYTIEQVNNLLNSLKLKLNDIIQSNINSLDKKITDLEKNKANRNELFSGSYNDLSDKPTIPRKISDLINDRKFVTNTTNNLVNYYSKIEVYTKNEVLSLIDKISTMSMLVVDTLPTENISSTTIYLVPTITSENQNVYEEYIYVNNTWELIGNTKVDLTGLVREEQVMDIVEENSEEVETLNIATSTNYDVESDVQIPTTKAVKGIVDNFKADEFEPFKNEVKENLIIQTEIGTSKDLGGIKAGTVLKGQTVLSVLEQLLFPYIAFTMNVQSISPSGTYEKGTSVTITSVTVKITSGTKPVTNIKLYESNKTTLLGEKTSGISTNNTFSINKTVTSAVSFYATATDGQSSLNDSSSFLAFYDPTFYGVLDVGYTLTSDLITGKSKELKANKSNTRTYNATNQHPFIAYPSSYGALTSIKDGNGFECISDFNNSTINLTVKSGTVSYRIYVLKSATTGEGYKYTFS